MLIFCQISAIHTPHQEKEMHDDVDKKGLKVCQT
jgi:hypothetical protein